MNIKLDTTGWRWFTVNSGRNLNLITQMLFEKTLLCPWKWEVWNSLNFFDTNRSSNPGQTTIPNDDQQTNKQEKKRKGLVVLWTLPSRQSKSQIKRLERQVIQRCLKIQKAVKYESKSHPYCNCHNWNVPTKNKLRKGSWNSWKWEIRVRIENIQTRGLLKWGDYQSFGLLWNNIS